MPPDCRGRWARWWILPNNDGGQGTSHFEVADGKSPRVARERSSPRAEPSTRKVPRLETMAVQTSHRSNRRTPHEISEGEVDHREGS